jgi:hypothetical protein
VRRSVPFLAALAASAALVGSYAALGGASYKPTPVASPCADRGWRTTDGLEATIEQVVLSALDGAACSLGVSREELVLALRSRSSLEAFAREHHISQADAARSIRDGLDHALDQADAAGALPGFVSSIARRVVESAELWRLIDVLESLRGLLG